jgi:hypothetical protein
MDSEMLQMVVDLGQCRLRVSDTYQKTEQLVSRCECAMHNSAVVRRLAQRILRVTEAREIPALLAEFVLAADHLKLIGDCLPQPNQPAGPITGS